MKEEKIIMYDSDQAAQYRTGIEGWVSSNGKFCGANEHMARWDGSTHSLCECGNVKERHYIRCKACRSITAKDNYLSKPYREYVSDEPVVLWGNDQYFFSEESLYEYCEEQEMDHIDLLVCSPNKYCEVGADYWSDIMPEDSDGELPEALEKALKSLNDVIATLPPCSYGAGNIRTTYYYKPDNEDK